MLSVGWAFAKKMIDSFVDSDTERTVGVCHSIAESELAVIEGIVSNFRASTESNLERSTDVGVRSRHQLRFVLSEIRRVSVPVLLHHGVCCNSYGSLRGRVGNVGWLFHHKGLYCTFFG